MSKQEATPQQPLSPEQEYQQMFSQLSTQFKAPLRNILGEAQEAVQNTISNVIQQLIQMNLALKNSNREVMRLQKLCTDNHISFELRSPNRAERRSQERKHAKEVKITSTLKK